MVSRATTLGRCLATLLVALWVAQPLVALVHSREHAHRYCPEHQTFEETSRGPGQAVSRLPEGAPLLSTRPAHPAEAPRLAHEECPLLLASTRGDVLAPEAMRLVSACLAVSRPATAPPSPGSSLPILATAPKASPPARV